MGGIQGSNTANLLTTKARMEANFKAQEAAVEQLRMQSSHAKDQVADQKVTVGNRQMDFDQAVTVLANFKVPEKPDEADYYVDVVKADGEAMDEKELDETAYNNALKEWQDAVDQKKALEAAVDKAREDLGISVESLNSFINKANEVEREFLKEEENKDQSIQDLQEINRQIAESEEKVTIDGSHNKNGMVSQTLNDLVDAGVITKAQLDKMTPAQKQAFANTYVSLDNENNDRNVKDGMDRQYTTGKITTGTFTASQLDQMLNDATNDSASYSGLVDDLKTLTPATTDTDPKPAPKPAPKTTVENDVVDPKYKKGKDGEIVLPQGDIKVGDATKPDAESTYATELAHYGIVEKDGKYYRAKKDENGNLVPRDNRAFTADEINKYFRQVEKDFGIKPGSSTETKTKTDVPAATTTNPSAEALRGFAAGYFDVDGSGVLTSPTVEGDKLVATGSDGKKYQAVFSNGAVSGWTPVTSTPAALAEVGAGDRPAVTTNTPSSSISVSSLPQQLQSAINGFEESEGKTVFKFDGQRADTYVTWSKTKNADGKFEMTFDVDGQKYRLAADKRSLIKVE